MNTREYIVPLSLYRQGDDFQSCLDWAENDLVIGLSAYAQSLEENAMLLRQLAMFVADHAPDTIGYGQHHTIHISGTQEALDQLLPQQILVPDQDEDLDPQDMEMIEIEVDAWCCGNCGCELSVMDDTEE